MIPGINSPVLGADYLLGIRVEYPQNGTAASPKRGAARGEMV